MQFLGKSESAVDGKAAKLDQVSVNSIWTQHVKKELSLLKLNEDFRLNPQSLVQNMITGKPNVDPARMGYKVSADPEIVAELDTVLKETKRFPKEKYPEPITSSHEIGWYSRPLMPNRKKFAVKNCEVTVYANDYITMMGRSPYATKEPIAKPT
uniref:Protein FAM183A n=1 Tax=Cryptomonas curvata TaxID=233186 RepID=A0A7S0MTP8_9CRYP|mmetsp:Transcript_52433/g.109395  ORF Transcript_52433/g.109395 Transcript_52433/m.109395 type:complete len:154 (+) Transcript_52433:27-488(+)